MMRNIIFTTFAIIFIIGCTSKVEDKNESKENTSFIVGKISATTDEKAVSSKLEELRSKTILFEACAYDIAVNLPISYKKFQVLSDKNKVISRIVSDESGCFTWTETFGLDDLNDGQRFYIDRIIEGLDVYKGKRDVKLLIDLYNNGNSVAYDTRHIDIKKINNISQEPISFKVCDLSITNKLQEEDLSNSYENHSRIEFCLKNTLDGKNITPSEKDPFIFFAKLVNKDELDSEIIFTENDRVAETGGGYFTRVSSFEYDDSLSPRYLEKYLVIKGGTKPFLDKKVIRPVWINPWSNVSGRFFWDGNTGNPPDIGSNEQSKLFIPDMSFSYLGNDDRSYRVNKFLDLKMDKVFSLNFTMKRKNFSSFDRMPTEILSDGRYKVELALAHYKGGYFDFENNLNIDHRKFQFITGKSFEVTANSDGRVNHEFNLPVYFKDLPYLSAQALMVIKVSSLDNARKNLRPEVFINRMIPISSSISMANFKGQFIQRNDEIKNKNANHLLLLEKRLLSKIENGKNRDDGWKYQNTVELYYNLKKKTRAGLGQLKWWNNKKSNELKSSKTRQQLKPWELKDSIILNKVFTKDYFIKTLATDPKGENFDRSSKLEKRNLERFNDLKKELCHLFYTKDASSPQVGKITRLDDCFKSPLDYIQIISSKHILELMDDPKFNESKIENGHVYAKVIDRKRDNFSLSVSRSSSIGQWAKKTIEEGFKSFTGFEWLNRFGPLVLLPTEAGYTIGVSWSESIYDRHSDDVNMSNDIRLGHEKIELRLRARTQTCLIIEGKIFKEKAKIVIGANQTEEDFQSKHRYFICSRSENNHPELAKINKTGDYISESWHYLAQDLTAKTQLFNSMSTSDKMIKIFRGEKAYDRWQSELKENNRSMFIYTEEIDERKLKNIYNQFYFVDEYDHLPSFMNEATPGSFMLSVEER